MPLANGHFSLCRVIRHTTAEEEKRKGASMALVAGSAWSGTDAPDLGDPQLRDMLVLTHHAHQGVPAMLWVEGSPPETYRRIGSLPPAEEEMQEEGSGSSGWEWFALQASLQWRWDHERETMLREDAEKEAQRKAAQVEGALRYQQYLDGFTLEGLRTKPWFSHWQPYVSEALVSACRGIFVDTIDALIALDQVATTRTRLRILQTCIQRFNDLDDQNGHFIATIEREDICEGFDEIVYACGLRNYKNLADRWRDW